MKRILVAVDAGESSARVAEFVNSFFGGLAVDITAINVGLTPLDRMTGAQAPGALHAWDVGPLVIPSVTPPVEVAQDGEVVEAAGERTIERSGLHEDHRIVERGDPVDAIIRAALEHDIDLIVVGSTHKGVLERFLAGSVSKELAESAPVPVLVVH